jgi:hypothetical protein
MTLWFGAPVSVSGTYGVTLFSGTNQTTGGVRTLAEAFIRGYHRCASGNIFILLGIGTSNCLIGGGTSTSQCDTSASYKTSTWVRAHGEAWGKMVNSIGTYIKNQGFDDRISIMAAWDMEPAWSSYGRAEDWMHGYDYDAPNQYPLWANMSADGCPYSTSLNTDTNHDCANGWNQFRMWHESWDHAPSWPFPQIYLTNGHNAAQWMRISEYGYHAQNYRPLYFFGAFSQHDAASSNCSCSNPDTNTSHQAHDQLLNDVQNHSHTNQDDFLYTSDVSWTLHDH